MKQLKLCATLSAVFLAGVQAAPNGSFIGQLHNIKKIALTVPSNGDVNPYGVAVVARTTGALVKGDDEHHQRILGGRAAREWGGSRPSYRSH